MEIHDIITTTVAIFRPLMFPLDSFIFGCMAAGASPVVKGGIRMDLQLFNLTLSASPWGLAITIIAIAAISVRRRKQTRKKK